MVDLNEGWSTWISFNFCSQKDAEASVPRGKAGAGVHCFLKRRNAAVIRLFFRLLFVYISLYWIHIENTVQYINLIIFHWISLLLDFWLCQIRRLDFHCFQVAAFVGGKSQWAWLVEQALDLQQIWLRCWVQYVSSCYQRMKSYENMEPKKHVDLELRQIFSFWNGHFANCQAGKESGKGHGIYQWMCFIRCWPHGWQDWNEKNIGKIKAQGTIVFKKPTAAGVLPGIWNLSTQLNTGCLFEAECLINRCLIDRCCAQEVTLTAVSSLSQEGRVECSDSRWVAGVDALYL